ncbi:dCTP deaminase [Kaistia sp. MMO-174]|uniref:dCTP deaminase n=1 Tax=Kaistia sp. MMO-174 TaxID=3081256 RepID=UPI0030174881
MRLPAQTIRRLCRGSRPIIWPFFERAVSNGRTFGLSSAGYDVRIAETIWVWPLWGRLASTIERFELPADLAADVKDKSSNARRFLTVQNTTGEPGWRGHLTLELTRHLPWPIRIKAGTPIAQIVLERLEEPTEQPYAGRYQDQEAGPQRARVARAGGRV